MSKNDENLVSILQLEYETLKNEQLKRIEHRDQIVYLQIGVIGVILGLGSDLSNYLVALVLPFPCIALGWIYLINDQKVSAIGKYIRSSLAQNLGKFVDLDSGQTMFEWEFYHANDKRRVERKRIQLFIDLFVFVFPGVLAVIVSLYTTSSWLARSLSIFELIAVLVIGWQIIAYADMDPRNKMKPRKGL